MECATYYDAVFKPYRFAQTLKQNEIRMKNAC
jgi:hypothetical protein